MPKKLLFEHVACGRCGGSGSYSYCSMYGSRCFGCNGAGYKLTKRGRAAQNFLDDLRSKPAGEVKVGDLVWFEDFFAGRNYCKAVESIEFSVQRGSSMTDGVMVPYEMQMVVLNAGGYSVHSSPDKLVKMGWGGEQKKAQREAALAYQATLGKNGLPLKKMKVAA